MDVLLKKIIKRDNLTNPVIPPAVTLLALGHLARSGAEFPFQAN